VRRERFLDLLLAAAAATLAFMLYSRTLAPGLLPGDSGEFQFAAWLGGFAHPTGYPLYLLTGRLWTHLLPFGDPAWRMNLFSAVWAALAVGGLYLLARQALLATARSDRGPVSSRLPALLAAALLAVNPSFWSQAIIAEVYTLHAALLVAILLALVLWAAAGSQRRLVWATLAFGLSLTHHRTTILWLPAIMLFAWLVAHSAQGAGLTTIRPRQVLALALSAFLPLLLYLYIPLTAGRTPYLHVQVGPDQILELYTPTVAGFFDYVTGRAFESEFRTVAAAAGRLLPEAQRLAAELTWPGVALGWVGLVWLAWRNRPLLVLTGLGFLISFVFNLFYGIGDIAAYYIPLYLVWALWSAAGVAGLSALAARRGRSSGRAIGLAVCLLAWLLPVYLLRHNYAQLDQSRNIQARTTWEAILAQEIPPAAILVTNDRDEMMPFWYMRYVEGTRPDLTGLFPLIRPGPDWADVVATIESARRSGRPVFLIKPMPGLEVKFRLEQVGALVRVHDLAASREPDRPSEVLFADAIRLIGYDLQPTTLTAGGDVTITLYWQPLRPLKTDYTTFVQILDAGDNKTGQSDHRPGGVYYPTSLWKPGETLADTHHLTLAADLGRPPHTILIGLYTGGPPLKHLGTPQRIGKIEKRVLFTK